MSIKGVSATQIYEINTALDKKSQHSDADKDANGQQHKGESEKRKFTEEEIKKAVKQLEQINGIKDNHLSVNYEQKGYVYVVYVTDMTGKVVRRILEHDLAPYLDQDEAKPSGHILNKAL